MFQLLEKLYAEFVDFKDTTNQRLENIDKSFDNIDKMFEGVDKRFEGLEKEVKKNSILLEEVKSDVRSVAEILDSHIKADAREHAELEKLIEDDISMVNNSIKLLREDITLVAAENDKNRLKIYKHKRTHGFER